MRRDRMVYSVLSSFVLAAFVAIAITGAAAAPRDTSPHLLVVPNSDKGKAALTASSARRIASYDEFTLVEASGDDVSDLIAVGADVRDDMREVRIGRATSDPSAARPALAGKGPSAQATKPGLAVVQFVGPVKDQWLASLTKRGLTLVTYMAQNAELVHGSADALNALADLSDASFIRAVTPYEAGDKLAPGISGSGKTQIVVSTVAGGPGDAARSAVAAASTPQNDAVTIDAITQQRVQLDAAAVAGLAGNGGVVAIEPFVAPKLLDERAAQIVMGNLTAGFQASLSSGYLAALAGRGITGSTTAVIDIMDEGLDKGVVPAPAGSHPDFYVAGNPVKSSRLIYAQEATATDTDARDCGGHGTNVASIAAGFNSSTAVTDNDAQNFNYGLGIDPFAKLGASKIFQCNGSFSVQTSFTALRAAAYANSARISNNSWGASVGGAYTADSREMDAITRDAQPAVAGTQQFVNVFSAGNSGAGGNTIGAPGTAKNVITVGAAENTRPIGAADGCGVPDTGADSARDIINFSSRGPTDDGRIKPDVVAPGTHVSGAQPQTGADFNGSGTCNPQFPAGSTKYTLVSGTSQAAPEVTGLSSVLRTWYVSLFGTAPSPAMTKAILVNTATSLKGGNDGAGGTLGAAPDQTQGYGRVNFRTIAFEPPPRDVNDQATLLGTTGGSAARHYTVGDTAKPVRVTMAFTDAPGPTTGNAFVNDLDLEVTVGGKTYKGNVLSNNLSVAGGTADPRNNVESVFLPAGTSGPMTVKVIAKNIVGDGKPGNADTTDQDYALFVSNGTAATSVSNLAHESTTISDTAGGDGDGIAEPGETLAITEALRNVGNAAATSVNGTLSTSTANTSVTGASSSWGTIAANAVKSGTPAFGLAIAPAFGCGNSVNASIAVTTASASYTVPVTIATGGPGAPVTHTSADVPKAIPDNLAAGVTSNLIVPAGPRVADVNVTVNITHTWDGDLKIELIHPDGTVVVLANRPGGIGNNGDNFTNTVFDDGAALAIGQGGTAPPYTGSFRPQADQLSRLNGKASAGTWKLRVSDLAGQDTGTLTAWDTPMRKLVCA